MTNISYTQPNKQKTKKNVSNNYISMPLGKNKNKNKKKNNERTKNKIKSSQDNKVTTKYKNIFKKSEMKHLL